MKYGLDVNNELVLRTLINVLERKGHFIVNLSSLKNKNTGALLYKKTLIANITKVDVYLGIEIDENGSESKIYFNEFLRSTEIRRKIINILQQISFKNVVEDKKQLYLSKNVNALVIYCKIATKESMIEREIIEKIVEVLDNIL